MSGNSSSSISSYPFLLTTNIRFWCILIVIIPSLMCSLFTLYHLLFDRTLRTTLSNHIIIVILLIALFNQVTVYPWMINYYNLGGYWERSTIFCYFSAFLSWTLYILEGMLFAWATIERHILIFHDRWLATKKKRFFFHYLPIVALIGYCLIYYICVDFFSPCTNAVYYTVVACGSFCIAWNYYYILWDTIAHQLVPGLIILIFSVALLIRVIWTKAHMNQPVQWRKYRKMSIQLLSISIVYLLCYFPYIFINSMFVLKILYNINIDILFIFSFLTYFMILLLPFVCLLTLPDLGKRIKYFWRLGRPPAAIHPSTLPVRQTGAF